MISDVSLRPTGKMFLRRTKKDYGGLFLNGVLDVSYCIPTLCIPVFDDIKDKPLLIPDHSNQHGSPESSIESTPV